MPHKTLSIGLGGIFKALSVFDSHLVHQFLRNGDGNSSTYQAREDGRASVLVIFQFGLLRERRGKLKRVISRGFGEQAGNFDCS